jgi:hypothetical protein
MAKPNQPAKKPKSRREILDDLRKYQRTGFLEMTDGGVVLSNAVRKETDRGLVIILGSITEDILTACVLSEFKQVSKALEKDLTRSGGALGTWAQLINVGLAFGLIDDDDAGDLEVFKAMRNACAHSRRHIDFNTPELREALSLLFVPKILAMPRTAAGRRLFRRMFVHAVHYMQKRIYLDEPKRTPEERFNDFMDAMDELRKLPPKSKPRRSKTASPDQPKQAPPRPRQS